MEVLADPITMNRRKVLVGLALVGDGTPERCRKPHDAPVLPRRSFAWPLGYWWLGAHWTVKMPLPDVARVRGNQGNR